MKESETSFDVIFYGRCFFISNPTLFNYETEVNRSLLKLRHCFVVKQRLQLHLNFLFPVCFEATLGIQKALLCQNLQGLCPWTPLGVLTACPQTPQLLWWSIRDAQSAATQVKNPT